MTTEIKLYAVSYGNGNDGVSHLYPDFYCYTDKPYDLAKLAIVTNCNTQYQDWAAERVEVDGEAEYTITGMLLDPPDDDEIGQEGEADNGSWSDANGAWMLAEVFQVTEDDLPDQSDVYGKKPYAGLTECFGADVVAKYTKE